MKIETVIDQLKDLIKDRHSFLCEDGEPEWNEIYIKDINALNQAIDELSKAIKKKPIKTEEGDICCPRCSVCFYAEGFNQIYKDNYCWCCGQAIDWSGNNEL